MTHLTMSVNEKGCDFVVGDIHGQFDLLSIELAKARFDKSKDRLFSVGDMIDKGSQSAEVLELLSEPWFFAVCGNHEELAKHHLDQEWDKANLWLFTRGGGWAIRYSTMELNEILSPIPFLPVSIEVPMANGRRYGIIHACPPPVWGAFNEDDRHIYTQGRRRFDKKDDSVVVGIDRVFVGHNIVPRVNMLGNVIYIDTGAYRTGNLTLINMTKMEV